MSMKMILAALLAGTFLISLPLKAEEKGSAPAGEKTDKGKKGKADKGDKKAEKGDKPAGGGGW
jgi:hypothetical protein